jgi:septal ring factor EnvC (AmiA/AmiB activator)
MAENEVTEVHGGTPSWMGPAIVVLAILSVAGLGYAWYDSNQLQTAQESFSGQMKTMVQNSSQQISALEQKQAQSDAANAQLQSDLGVVTKRLKVTQGDLQKARTEAQQEVQENADKLAQMDTDVKGQLATKASTDDLSTTNTNVTAVKTDLAGTKSDLNMARSELGTLIAKNHDEVDALRRMGERDYVEFTVEGKKAQKVGPLTVELHSVNTKKNQFTVALVVDDLRTEKKDRAVNEPIVFYPRGSHQADEFVVNQVTKDKITGYISVPKNPGVTTSASSGS